MMPKIIPLEERIVLSANVIYVDANVSSHSNSNVHDGSSWAHAFSNLQDALNKAASTSGADQIWIAQGTYKPSQIYSPVDGSNNPVVGGASGLNTPNLKTFNLPDNVSLYGGFAYGMTSLAQRNPTLFKTVLSGDLAGNDINNPSAPGYAANKADNAWHVVTLGNDVTHVGVTAALDGLTIVNGYANGPNNGGTLSPFIYGHSDGGGVYSAWGSNLSVKSSLFQYNYAGSDGGGLFSDGSNLVVASSRFLNNAAITRAGALEALNDFEVGSHTALIKDSYFQDNTSTVFGGAIVGEGAFQGPGSSMTIKNSTFVHNQAAEGGAIVIDTLPVLITGSNFTNNIATVNGGALSTTNVVGTIVGAPNNFATTIRDSTFYLNVAINDPVAHATLNNFVGAPGLNFAGGGGALVAYMNGYLNVEHSVFSNNSTIYGDGGAILNGDASANLFGISAFAVRTNVSDSIFMNNVALHGKGGAIASESDHLSPGATVASTELNVTGSKFVGNKGGLEGGGIYLDSSKASITSNAFTYNASPIGDGVYGIASIVNGIGSNDPAAVAALKAANIFIQDDVFLA